jgi:hypothetical protein
VAGRLLNPEKRGHLVGAPSRLERALRGRGARRSRVLAEVRGADAVGALGIHDGEDAGLRAAVRRGVRDDPSARCPPQERARGEALRDGSVHPTGDERRPPVHREQAGRCACQLRLETRQEIPRRSSGLRLRRRRDLTTHARSVGRLAPHPSADGPRAARLSRADTGPLRHLHEASTRP